jgi:hypothetical protein
MTAAITSLVESFKAMAYWSAKMGMGLRQTPVTLEKPGGGKLGLATPSRFSPGGKAIGGVGTFSNGRGFGSDQNGGFAVYGGGKLDPKATETQRLIRAFLLNDGDPGRGRGGLGAVGGDLMKRLLGSGMGKNAADLFGQASKLPGMAMGAWGKFLFDDMMGGHRMKAAGMGGHSGSLAFAESGSADSYRQQAAIRKQGEQIQKNQLTTQKQMLGELKKINANPGLLVANFGK